MRKRSGTKESKAQRAQRLAKLEASLEAAVGDPRFDPDPRVAATALKLEAEAKRGEANPTEGGTDVEAA